MLTTKLGRNDPCACGSGKKYKKCCMELESVAASHVYSVDFKWHRLRQLEDTVINQHILPYVKRELPDLFIREAFFDCLPESLPTSFDEELICEHYFLPWFLFNWIPDDTFWDHTFELEQFDFTLSLAENYLKKYGNRLNAQEKRFIGAMSQSYYSFYSIEHVEPEKALVVKDILLGTTHTLKERRATRTSKPGHIVLSRILTLDDQSIFIGMLPYIIPAHYQCDFLDYRDWLIDFNDDVALTPDALRFDFDGILRDHFFDVLKTAYDNPLPILQNTDGESLQFSKSYFKLTISPEEAFNHLKPLTFDDDPDEFLREAKKDKSGALKEIQFSWIKTGNKLHKSWDNTVLGHITLQNNRLIVETNSQERTEHIKNLVSQYLGEEALFQQTLIETPEQKMKSFSHTKATKNKDEPNLMDLPDVQEHLKTMVQTHWENWFDEPIPALKNKTPRESATTKQGRERLEALLVEYAYRNLENSSNPFNADIQHLKKELGLENDDDG